MNIAEQLTSDLKDAMLARDSRLVEVLRYLKSALQTEQIASQHELANEEVMKVLQKELKKRHEAVELYEKAGDAERQASEREEAEIIQKYLPQPLSEDEVKALVDAAMAEVGEGAHQGAIIQHVLKAAAGKADGGTVSRLVREKLGQ